MAQAEKTFYDKFLNAQAEMPKLQKDGENPHFRSQFITLDNILHKVLPILHKHGLYLVNSGIVTGKQIGRASCRERV